MNYSPSVLEQLCTSIKQNINHVCKRCMQEKRSSDPRNFHVSPFSPVAFISDRHMAQKYPMVQIKFPIELKIKSKLKTKNHSRKRRSPTPPSFLLDASDRLSSLNCHARYGSVLKESHNLEGTCHKKSNSLCVTVMITQTINQMHQNQIFIF